MAMATWRDDRGQATVEHLGMVMVVALLMGAMAVWVAAQVGTPARPPDVIGRITAPLGTGRVLSGDPPHIYAPPALRGRPGLLHRAWDGFLGWGALNVDGEVQAFHGFVEEMKGQAERVVTDPVGTAVRLAAALRGVPSVPIPPDPPPDPPAAGGDPLDQLGIWGYLWDAPKRPWRETAMGLSRIAGRRAADWVVTRWFRWLGGRVAGAVPVR